MKNITVMGDVILDVYQYGNNIRTSAEAPVQIIDIDKTEYGLGGAANVARNIVDFSDDIEVELISIVGNDMEGEILLSLLNEYNNIVLNVREFPRRTTTKTRIISGGKQVIRLDSQQSDIVEFDFDFVQPDVFVFSDYDFGVITKDVIDKVKFKAECPIIADPKRRNFWNYTHLDCITPNIHEAWTALCCKWAERTLLLNEISKDCPVILAQEINSVLNCDNILITLGASGMQLSTYVQPSGFRSPDTGCHLPAESIEVFDVTGAGDTVLGVMAWALASGYTMDGACRLSNKAAAKVVQKFGCATTTLSELSGDVV
tara:strand:+ start:2668 stop:3615 length:948 start_codon:yes stop_codon:yes gene_type:complete